MEPLAGGEAVFKLGQKEVPSPPEFSRMTITNVYLSAAEYDVLAVLPARELRKRRHSPEEDGRTYGLDVFEPPPVGLVLAEVGVETERELDEQSQLPQWVVREVSDDVRYTGGAPASLRPDEAAALLRELDRRRATPR